MRKFIGFISVISICISFYAFQSKPLQSRIVSHIVDTKSSNLRMFYQDENGSPIGNFKRLKSIVELKDQQLKFAMNGGMYLKDQSPQGLYIEDGVTIKKVNLMKSNYGNFYMEPNGVFGLDKSNNPILIPTSEYKSELDLIYATQSGPMLLINGEYHPRFNKGSENIHIRNGVGVLPDGKIIFAMSTERINFYDFATFFKEKGCVNALYLDGFVSKLYLPEKGILQEKGNFGVIIGEVVCK